VKFKLDENLPAEAAELLQRAGHSAMTAGEQGLAGGEDVALAERARLEQRAIVTLDLDFGDIRAYPPDLYPGIIVLRCANQDKRSVLWLIERFLRQLVHEPLAGCLWIVEPGHIRIREGKEQ
jgi:predicted nuclease of predicted toxin-antitoxin system